MRRSLGDDSSGSESDSDSEVSDLALDTKSPKHSLKAVLTFSEPPSRVRSWQQQGGRSSDPFNSHTDIYADQWKGVPSSLFDDVTVVDTGAYPPLFTGGCCRGGHDLNIYIFLVVLAVSMNLSGALAVLITDTLGDTTSDAFVAGAVLISLGLPLLYVSLHAFNLRASHDLAHIIYTFDELEADENPSPDQVLIEKPQISDRALKRKDLEYNNLMATASAVTAVVPILSTVAMLLIDVCILSLRAFNERHETLVLSILVYFTVFGLGFYLIAYKYRQERTLALVLTLRPSVMADLREGHREEPKRPLFIGGRTRKLEDQTKIKIINRAIEEWAVDEVAHSERQRELLRDTERRAAWRRLQELQEEDQGLLNHKRALEI